MSLPLSLFNCFDPYASERVNMYEIFLMLALFSLGPVERKTRFCFEMFDIDGSGELQMVRACAPSRSWSGVDLPKKVWWLTVYRVCAYCTF